MERFELLSRRHNCPVRSGWLAHDIFLTRFRHQSRAVISYDHHLPPALRHLGVALMFAVLKRDWPGERFGLRFAPPGSSRLIRAAARKSQRDYESLMPVAAQILVPDHLLRETEGESVWCLCWRHEIPPQVVALACGIEWRDRDTVSTQRRIWDMWQAGF